MADLGRNEQEDSSSGLTRSSTQSTIAPFTRSQMTNDTSDSTDSTRLTPSTQKATSRPDQRRAGAQRRPLPDRHGTVPYA